MATPESNVLTDELWAVLHGMAVLYLDRSAAFDLGRAQDCVARLLLGTRDAAQFTDRKALTIQGDVSHGESPAAVLVYRPSKAEEIRATSHGSEEAG